MLEVASAGQQHNARHATRDPPASTHCPILAELSQRFSATACRTSCLWRGGIERAEQWCGRARAVVADDGIGRAARGRAEGEDCELSLTLNPTFPRYSYITTGKRPGFGDPSRRADAVWNQRLRRMLCSTQSAHKTRPRPAWPFGAGLGRRNAAGAASTTREPRPLPGAVVRRGARAAEVIIVGDNAWTHLPLSPTQADVYNSRNITLVAQEGPVVTQPAGCGSRR